MVICMLEKLRPSIYKAVCLWDPNPVLKTWRLTVVD